ncbi:hypothetical protein F5141DRAFT_1217717 [Pisolithus sp. B1]|nr:hypothetical protein F5141DRAFT_1217717 [Pisolithus sp. B1]
MDTPPGTTRFKTPVTYTNTCATSQASFKDPLATQISIITDHATGLHYLLKRDSLPLGINLTIDRLATALFLIAQLPNVLASAIDRIWAVAFLMEKVGTMTLAMEIQHMLCTSLTEMITNHVIALISPHIASMWDTALALRLPTPLASPTTNTQEDLLPHVKSIHTSVNAIQKKMPLLEAIHKHLVGTGGGNTLASISASIDHRKMLVDDVGAGLSLVTEVVNTLLPSLNTTQAWIDSLHRHLILL